MAPCHAPGRAEHSNSQGAAIPPKGFGWGSGDTWDPPESPKAQICPVPVRHQAGNGFHGVQRSPAPAGPDPQGGGGSKRILQDKWSKDQVQRHFIGGMADLVDQSKVDDLGGLFQPKLSYYSMIFLSPFMADLN